jgi:hypothetical protein
MKPDTGRCIATVLWSMRPVILSALLPMDVPCCGKHGSRSGVRCEAQRLGTAAAARLLVRRQHEVNGRRRVARVLLALAALLLDDELDEALRTHARSTISAAARLGLRCVLIPHRALTVDSLPPRTMERSISAATPYCAPGGRGVSEQAKPPG